MTTNYTIDFANGESCVLEFDPSNHEYRLSDSGEVIPSATQILGIIAKPGLIYWAALEGSKYFKKSVAEVNVFKEESVYNPVYTFGDKSIDDVAKGISNAHSKAANDAAGIGSTVHNFIEKCVKFNVDENEAPFAGKWPTMPENEQAQKSISAFFDWHKSNNVKWISSEEKVMHPQLKYAGTVDAIAEVNDEFCVIDFKTSSKVYPEHHMQCAAYAKAVELIYDRVVDCTYVLRFDKKTGKHHVHRSDRIGEDFVAFRAAMVLDQRLKGSARGKRKRKNND